MPTAYKDGAFRDDLSGDPLTPEKVIDMIADVLRSLPPKRQQQAILAVQKVVRTILDDMIDAGDATLIPVSSDSQIDLVVIER